MNQSSNKEINLIDMLWWMLEHFVVIVLAAILGLVLGLGLAYVKQQGAIAKANELAAAKELAASQDQELSASRMIYIEGVSDCLSIDDKRMLESYFDYQKVYDDQVIFNSTDQMMQYDPNNVYTKRLMYIVSALSDECDVRMVSRAYTYLISSNGDVNKVAFYGEQYIGSSLSIDGEEGTLYPTDNEIAVITVTIKGRDQEDLDRLTDIITDSFDSQFSSINDSYGPFDIKLNASETSVVEDADVLAYQQKFINNLYSYRSSMISLEGKFSEEAKEYMEQYRERQALGLLDGDQIDASSSSDIALSKKTVIITMMAFVFVVMLVMAFIYAFSPYVRLSEDLGRFIDVATLARIADTSSFNIIKKGRYAGIVRLGAKEATSMLASRLKMYAKSTNAKDIYVSASVLSDGAQKTLGEVSDATKNEAPNLIIGQSALTDASAYEQAFKSGHVLIVCLVGKTKVADVISEIQLLRENQVNVVGVVIL